MNSFLVWSQITNQWKSICLRPEKSSTWWSGWVRKWKSLLNLRNSRLPIQKFKNNSRVKELVSARNLLLNYGYLSRILSSLTNNRTLLKKTSSPHLKSVLQSLLLKKCTGRSLSILTKAVTWVKPKCAKTRKT